MTNVTRRTVLGLFGAGVTSSMVGSWSTELFGSQLSAGPADDALPDLPDEFPSQARSVVRQVVGASHARIDRVRELVTARPALAKASWDWGFGDWETALGAASHTGRRDIAQLLIDHGARPDLFTFALLGHVDAVRSIVTAMPGAQRCPGPHGISLLQHAKNSLRRNDDAAARSTVEYLEELGDANPRPTSLETDEAAQQIYVGTYRFGPGERDTLIVEVHRNGSLALRRADGPQRILHRCETHGFAPAGAADVRLRFDVTDGKATVLTAHDPMPVVRATRVE